MTIQQVDTEELEDPGLARACKELSNDELAAFAVCLFVKGDETSLPFYSKIKAIFEHRELDDVTKAAIMQIAAYRFPPITAHQELLLGTTSERED